MGTGTAAKGKLNKGSNHIPCRRCGKKAFHKKASICASCGFGRSPKLRTFAWNKKNEAA